jgi:hypothetical protein
VPDGTQGIILYDTESKKSQILFEDKTSVFSVMKISLSQEWVIVSKMPANPDEAHGSNEQKLLVFVPQKKVVYHPQYGNIASLIDIELKDDVEQVQWLINDETVSIALMDLQKLCINGQQACSESGTISYNQENKFVNINEDEQNEPVDSIIIGGWLKLNISQDIIIGKLGLAEEKGDDKYWGATGTFVQEWRYATQGLIFSMESDSLNGLKILRSIIMVAPCQLTTEEKVGIGTDINLVKSIYGNHIDKAASNQDMIVIGSLYKGMVLTIENNKVSKLFIGAAAE